ncbi:hypothetical protein HXX76_015615 [Chlamydomonas incerta]|uniref:FAD-binding domain-containing protein n=1 Tax=Chlamydomonas incerta TaxID=51695 RepID=A0A835SE20_CHLIN|nr:hypothetical protein HXX76_015615 [Chlamydomonas incerta]|eukprot:KAG2423017.1 hypothetical protein HXX76_015615 [Chlamydomonas incerta]
MPPGNDSSPMRVDVAVVGGGPAGLSTALALSRVLPTDVSMAVFEGRCPGEAGSGIDLSENGLLALQAISPRLLQRFYEVGDFQNSWSHYDDANAQLVKALALPQTGAERKAAGLLPPLKMRWWAITRVLEQELPAGVGLHYGCKLMDCCECAEDEAALAAAPAEEGPLAAAAAADEGSSGERSCGTSNGGGGAPAAGGTGGSSERYRYRLTFQRRGDVGCSASSAASAAGATQQTVLAKWLIGADGAFSRVRRTVGDGRASVFTGRFSWWGRVSGAELAAAAAAAGGADVDQYWPAPLRGPPGSPLVRNAIYLPAADRISTTQAVLALVVRLRAPSLGRQGREGAAGERGSNADGAGLGPQQQQQGDEGPAGSAGHAVAAGGGSGSGNGDGGAAGSAAEGEAEEVVAWYLEALAEHLEAAGLDASPEGTHLRHSAPDGGHEVALARGLAVCAHLPPDVRACLAATPPARVLERALHMHPPEQLDLSSWTNGRGLVLVGDAVHSAGRPDGQGGSLAIEDGAELAAAVRRHGLGQQAFDAFAASRLPRVRGIRGDNAPPFALRRALMDATAFEPLWGPGDLPPREELLAAQLAQMRAADGDKPCKEAGVEGQGGGGHQQAAAGVVAVVAHAGVVDAAVEERVVKQQAAVDVEPYHEAVRAWSRRRCWEIAERRTGGQVLQRG